MSEDEGGAAAPSNLDRLLAQLPEGGIAHRLAIARKAAATDTVAGDALKKVIEDRKGELRKKYGTGTDHEA
jgi:hypothetical protein